MSNPRVRPLSPGARPYLDAPRSSAGTVLPSTYDTRFGQQPRNSFSTASSTRNSVYETQPVRKSTYADQYNPGGTIMKTEYTVKPRRNSQIPDVRHPLSVITRNTSPSQNRPGISSGSRDLAIASAFPASRDDPGRFLQPAYTQPRRNSQHHQRHNSATKAESDRYLSSVRDGRQKEYHRNGPYVEKIYPAVRPPLRYNEEDGYSYTGPREQFARDYPDRPPHQRDNHSRKERPVSAIDMADYKQVPVSRRELGPPPAASRQLERIEQSDQRTRTGFESEPDRTVEPKRRNSTRNPILHQSRDEGYSSARDDYNARRPSKVRDARYEEKTTGHDRVREPDRDIERERSYRKDRDREREREKERDRERDRERPRDRERDRDKDRDRNRERERERDHDRPREHEREREREKDRVRDREVDTRHRPKSRDPSPEHSGLKALTAAAGLGGLAAVGIGQRDSRKSEPASESDEGRQKRHRKHRHRRRHEDPDGPVSTEERENRVQDGSHRSRNRGGSSSDTPDDQSSRKSQPRRRSGSGKDQDPSDFESDGDQLPPVTEVDRDREAASHEYERPRQEPLPEQEADRDLGSMEGRTLSPGENEDGRPRRVQLVEPVKDRDREDVRPRGILKPPRAVPFPEDPNPTREGVAPLKEAGKEGVPQGARWTKISRMLVNPEALERAHERFEERDEYVIVLRVVSREEIQKFAEKTKEIREARERAWQQQLEDRRRHKSEREPYGDEPGTEDDEEDTKKPLAIEPPPDVPPPDLRSFQSHGHPEATTSALVPEINLEGYNYSSNV